MKIPIIAAHLAAASVLAGALSNLACAQVTAGSDASPGNAAAQAGGVQTVAPQATGTRIARWQDDKKAVFLLMFDDGWPSHFQSVLPELKKRDMIGTFYICPGKGEYKQYEKNWLQDMTAAGMVMGNHTFTHDGFQGAEDTEKEITQTTDYILSKYPGKNPRLLSFALPGVKDYNYGDQPLKAYLDKNNLVSRGDFRGHGANYHVKTVDEMLAIADKGIAAGGVEFLVFHGVERTSPNWPWQDMWAVKLAVFQPFLDALKERRDRGDLWITDHISSHQYEVERDGATLSILEETAANIRLTVKTTADPKFYDLPLTLVTRVPGTWKRARITQGEVTSTADVVNGGIRYRVVPDGTRVNLEPVL